MLGALVAGVALLPAAAHAKGSKLRFAEEAYAPGDRALAQADAKTWPGSGNEPGGGPYWVYLVRGTEPLHFGYLPRDAIRVGKLEIGRLVGTDTYRVKVDFDVPRVRDGRYAVWVCRAECGADSGFGDLVYGYIVVARDRHSDAEAVPLELGTPSTPQDAAWRAGIPWIVVALAALAALILAVALFARKSHRPARQEVPS